MRRNAKQILLHTLFMLTLENAFARVSRMNEDHSGYVEKDFFFSDDCYTAKCSCGWEGRLRDFRAIALADIQNHYDEIAKGESEEAS